MKENKKDEENDGRERCEEVEWGMNASVGSVKCY
jgi:hypothetical protein